MQSVYTEYMWMVTVKYIVINLNIYKIIWLYWIYMYVYLPTDGKIETMITVDSMFFVHVFIPVWLFIY